VVDKRGTVVPYADNLIRFEVIGNGYVRGVGNGDPNSHELDNVPYRHAFAGWCQALITSDIGASSLKIRACSENLESAEIDLQIEALPAPLCPRNITNYILEGFTMSEVTESKPDATAEIADNDMNSFTPIQFVKDVFQSDFRNGWRIYRTKPKTAKDGIYRLDFLRARFAYGEIYVDGELVDRIESPVRGGYVSAPFPIKADTTPDIRILLHVDHEVFPAAGISGRVEMKETK
jgi:beta-galactosidase